MLLVRLNADSQTINVMSIPRDLQVTIPGVGVDQKLNARLLGRRTQPADQDDQGSNVFPDLHVNHIIDVNFDSFQALVNAIGCVYADVDHRYYNNTLYTGYSSIDIQPGYQKLCGADALAFVRFRHTDSDIVRNARQQDFIRWAKDQYGVGNILANRDKLLRIFGAEHADRPQPAHRRTALINLFDLVAFYGPGTGSSRSSSRPSCTQCPPDCNVTADPAAEAAIFRAFMQRDHQRPGQGRGQDQQGQGQGKKGAKLSTAGLIADTADGKAQESALASVGMPVYYPKLIVAGTATTARA